MATLTPDQLTAMRQELSRSGIPVNYTKPQINAAIQAVEDVLVSPAFRLQISNAIDTATAPFVLTAAQKRELFKAAVRRLAERWS